MKPTVLNLEAMQKDMERMNRFRAANGEFVKLTKLNGEYLDEARVVGLEGAAPHKLVEIIFKMEMQVGKLLDAILEYQAVESGGAQK